MLLGHPGAFENAQPSQPPQPGSLSALLNQGLDTRIRERRPQQILPQVHTQNHYLALSFQRSPKIVLYTPVLQLDMVLTQANPPVKLMGLLLASWSGAFPMDSGLRNIVPELHRGFGGPWAKSETEAPYPSKRILLIS